METKIVLYHDRRYLGYVPMGDVSLSKAKAQIKLANHFANKADVYLGFPPVQTSIRILRYRGVWNWSALESAWKEAT